MGRIKDSSLWDKMFSCGRINIFLRNKASNGTRNLYTFTIHIEIKISLMVMNDHCILYFLKGVSDFQTKMTVHSVK